MSISWGVRYVQRIHTSLKIIILVGLFRRHVFRAKKGINKEIIYFEPFSKKNVYVLLLYVFEEMKENHLLIYDFLYKLL